MNERIHKYFYEELSTEDANFDYKLDKKKQPTKALIMEGIGLVFFIYLLLVNSLANRSSETEAWLNDHGTPVFLIGLIFIGISYFMFKRFKKKQPLTGLGYAGYIVSCIAVILVAIIIVISIAMLVLTFAIGGLH